MQLPFIVKDDRAVRDPSKMGEAPGLRHQYIRYLGPDGLPLVEVSQFVRPDGSLAASGRPDPKAIRVGNVIWDSRVPPLPEPDLSLNPVS